MTYAIRESKKDFNSLFAMIQILFIFLMLLIFKLPHPNTLFKEMEYSPSPWGEGAGG
jgi:hypothetical protein